LGSNLFIGFEGRDGSRLWLQILTVILLQRQNFATISIYDENYIIRIEIVKSDHARAVISSKEVYILTSVYALLFAFRIEV
jgi:hypothetical protein